jgi:hypothetical protein
MGIKERRIYLVAIRKRYQAASKTAKAAILDEFCAVCGYHRKSAIRLLAKGDRKPRRRPGRPPRYQREALLPVLKQLWLATDQMCSKKLVAALPLWLPFYERREGSLDDDLRAQLLAISPATLDRLLAPVKLALPSRGRCGTKPGSLLRNQIPIRTSNWDITRPGFVEADTVAHCGNSLAGDFIWSLTLTDISSGWTECRAMWNNGATGVIAQIKDIEAHLAFPLEAVDCDNGSEFLNHHLVRYFGEHKPRKIKFTRTRPYRKNDNAHVEQKNYSHVRHLLGYDRLEDSALVPLINHLYTHAFSAYHNHFCPNLKLKHKERRGSRYHKTYYPPQTPYQRLLDSPDLSQDQKDQLIRYHESLDPFKLKKQIERELKAIFRLVSVTRNVRKRL